MTRFMQEITGALGDYWKNSAEKEVREHVEKAEKESTVDKNGVIRWKSNNRCLMDDYCEMLEYAGYNFSREATREARDIENAESIRRYRESQKNRDYTEEEKAEMIAAFGKGTTIVDVLTGRKITL